MSFKRRSGGGPVAQAGPQPEGKIRQSQIVTTFGPGAMVDLVQDAVLIGGLDFWHYDPASVRFADEPRLREMLVGRMEENNRKLRLDHPFVLPPAGKDNNPTRDCGIEALEFPQWFVCQNPACRALVRSDGLSQKSGTYLHDCAGSRMQSPCVPVRFVMACKKGHIQDVPWIHFVHGGQGKPRCAAPSLSLREGATGDFSEIRVACACGVSRPLSNAMVEEANPNCEGLRPWLGSEGREMCDQKLKLLVRTASNSYFTLVESAVSIPDGTKQVRERVEKVWDVVKVATEATLPAFRTIPNVNAALQGLSDPEVLGIVEQIRSGVRANYEPPRTAEFKQLVSAKPEAPGDVPPPEVDFFARKAAPKEPMPRGIAKLVLVKKLREVRAQVGFTRFEAPSPNFQGEFDLGVQAAPLGLQTDWLPAVEIRGEGLFIQLDEAAVQAWENRAEVLARGAILEEAYKAWQQQAKGAPEFPGVRYYMLHSLAHLLISAVSLDCGYPASAIRERIYCAPADNATPMAALLLSTGTSGTEGTLGGLVEQGRYLTRHLQRAYELGTLCSNDPVCSSHQPNRDLTDRPLEGAACHGCLFIAECSCERFNKYLDRALVVPTLGHENVAFFGERP